MSPMIPLYRGHGAPSSYPVGGHSGLWWDKFCNQWVVAKGTWSLEAVGKEFNPKLVWIRDLTGTRAGDPKRLTEAVTRLEDLVDALGGVARRFRTEGRFVTGMGREHPVENGFTWHPTLGVPYLSGSSLKGAIRAWAEHWEGPGDGREALDRIFGPRGQESRDVGSIVFFDAIPWAPVTLEADVMTPHYAPYYQAEGGNPPADWYGPTPIPFLSVAAGQGFLLAVAPRRNGNAADIRMVEEWLEPALAWMGVGGKTAVGYGRFVPDQKAQAAAEQRRSERRLAEARGSALSTMSPVQREMVADGYDNDPDRFMQFLTTKWLPRMDDAETPGDDRREIARLLARWYQTHRPRDWERPGGKNVAKVQRIRAVMEE